MGKFDKITNKFDELREKLKKTKEDKEKVTTKQEYDNSHKFSPILPVGKPKATYQVRILPNIHEETDEPWIKGNYHMFRKADGKFVYTLCPTTFDKDAKCPMCEESKRLFATKDKLDENRARDLWRKPRYFANVFVRTDPRTGEECQDGKVLIWEFGTQIFDKLADALVEDEINFYHPFEGVDFNLIIKKKGEHPNYDSSHFSSEKRPISDKDKMDGIYDSIYNLKEKIFGKGAFEYDKLLSILNGSGPEKKNSGKKSETKDSTGEDTIDDDDVIEEEIEVKPPKKVDSKKSDMKKNKKSDDDDDDYNFDFEDDEDK